ncbi:Magnesium transporter [Penicillium odoratum]|uniref:Magnesium transporter n=1 Tax=Penicillium odoratum TaxID=1167516 RepID=UPI002548B5CF|nr:Magnesium transporter [Penicillium odoratum]KAJ5752617.1 Magnesium transporter [Penicillium odoratum]
MSFLSRVATLFGLVLLVHAGYSAHEHAVLFSNANIAAIASLPGDIIVETLAAVLAVSIGLVLGAEKLKPISWRDWAGEIERDGGARNPYLGMEERYGFWDIRAKRKEFADWVRGQEVLTKE